ncbi:alpha mannosidase-like protein [Podila epicladia]|nr:alpha mannosidase-like protein [Podila epicladia]KAG0095094.1 alpha mannosidase-like protein [Podila epicladia]
MDVHGPTLDAAGPLPRSIAQDMNEQESECSSSLIASFNSDDTLGIEETFGASSSLHTSPTIPAPTTGLSSSSSNRINQGAIVTNINNFNNNGSREGAVRPWILFIVFTIVQLILSSPLPSNGVNASASSDQSPATDSPMNGGGGNNARGGTTRAYFRILPPLTATSSSPGKIVSERMTEARRVALRQEAKDMFMHGFRGYLTYAFPKDELNPVNCRGRGPDRLYADNINVNDVLGDFSLTLIDSLDTLATMREPDEFAKAIRMTKRHIQNFNINSRVQVFEVNIRVLGALLSAHQYASDPRFLSLVQDYKGELLALAVDLGKRLMKAFENSPTGIPWPRVNLKKGLLKWESSETCVAGAGSLLLEFGTLSRLSGDPSYEASDAELNAAKRALHELWRRRTKIGLVGNTINVTSGEWMSAMTGIGAGTDSFYEYLLKSYVLFGDDQYLEMYETAAEAIKRNLLHDSKYFYKHVHLLDGSLLASWVDSLSAFMPGVQVLAGDLESAIKNHLYYYNIWRRYQAIPERFDFLSQAVDITNYPLRPEFIESNYFLYRATKDPFYLEVGEMILRDLQKYTKTSCGWASLQSVVDKKKEDRMESFALSETFKYLYLLFDEENLLHNELKDSNFVFTTEGHVLSLTNEHLRRPTSTEPELEQDPTPRHQYVMKGHSRHQHPRPSEPKPWPMCPVYEPPATFLKSIPYRPDADFARQMVGTRPDARDLLELDPNGFCEKPVLETERVTVEFSGGYAKTFFVDDVAEGEAVIWKDEAVVQKEREKEEAKALTVIPISKGVFISRIVKVKMQLQYDDVQNGYRAVKVGDYPLSANSNVYITRSSLQPLWDTYQRQQVAHLRVYKPAVQYSDNTVEEQVERSRDARRISMVPTDIIAQPADFGYWRPRILDYDQPGPASSEYPLTSLESHFDSNINNDDASQYHGANISETTYSHAQGSTRKPVDTKPLVRIDSNTMGCRPFTPAQVDRIRGRILVLDRGGCLFILKAYYAQATGAYGVVVINSDDSLFAMTGASADLGKDVAATSDNSVPTSSDSSSQLGDMIPDKDIDITTVMVGHSAGQLLLDLIREEEILRPEGRASKDQPRLVAGFVQKKLSKSQLEDARLSYNNLPIVNIRTLKGQPMATYG